MEEKWIEVKEYTKEGYSPIIDFEKWRVAILNDCEELEVDKLETMQKHNETDEVFVLLEGACVLFLAGGESTLDTIQAVKMEPCKAYNVKKGIWHTHTLEKGSKVLIVENADTCEHNSPHCQMSIEEKKVLIESYQKI